MWYNSRTKSKRLNLVGLVSASNLKKIRGDSMKILKVFITALIVSITLGLITVANASTLLNTKIINNTRSILILRSSDAGKDSGQKDDSWEWHKKPPMKLMPGQEYKVVVWHFSHANIDQTMFVSFAYSILNDPTAACYIKLKRNSYSGSNYWFRGSRVKSCTGNNLSIKLERENYGENNKVTFEMKSRI